MNIFNEIWKDIIGYENYYKISNIGNVKSLERLEIFKNGKTYLRRERILKKRYCVNGYETTCLCK